MIQYLENRANKIFLQKGFFMVLGNLCWSYNRMKQHNLFYKFFFCIAYNNGFKLFSKDTVPEKVIIVSVFGA